jgi:uncharacterized sulfatase
MLTGLYPHQHKLACNDPPEGADRRLMDKFMQRTPTVPRLLQTQGYRSFQTGKFWEGHHENGGFTHGMTVKGRHGDDGLVIGRQTMQPIYDFIEQGQDKPFFVWYAPMLPHQPHNPPQRLLKKYAVEGRDPDFAKYYAMCEWFDETCGQLLDWLDQKKLGDNTLVVFVVDNGWIQLPAGQPGSRVGRSSPKSKLSPYDGGVRTPILLRWPGRIKPGRYEDLVSSIDLAPTILAACGAAPPPGLPGLNLLDRAAGGPALKRDAVFGAIFSHTASDIENPARDVVNRWVRSGDWKLIVFDAKPKPAELYNLAKDPHEEKDLAAAQPAEVQRLTNLLDAWWRPRPQGGAP